MTDILSYRATQLGYHHPSQGVHSITNSFQALVIRQIVQLWQFQAIFTRHRLISDQFSPTESSSAKSCYNQRGEEMAHSISLDHLLLRSWMLQKTLFCPISSPDCFAEISSHPFSSLHRYTPARLHFKSLLGCWFQSFPKSLIIQETDV